MTFLGSDQCTPDEVAEALFGLAPILFLTARASRHDEYFARVGDALACESAQTCLHVVAQHRATIERKT